VVAAVNVQTKINSHSTSENFDQLRLRNPNIKAIRIWTTMVWSIIQIIFGSALFIWRNQIRNLKKMEKNAQNYQIC